MKIYKELNDAMRAGRIPRNSIKKQNEAGIVLAIGLITAFLIVVLSWRF